MFNTEQLKIAIYIALKHIDSFISIQSITLLLIILNVKRHRRNEFWLIATDF